MNMDARRTRRRQPRVRYDANVTIRAQSQPQALRARAHDLSPDGMGVNAEQALQTGEEVECRLLVAGRRARLRGRVAWARTGNTREQPFGGGIQFHSLGGEDRELLGRLIAGPVNNPQRAEVFIPGLDHPVRMRAIIGTDEVKLGLSVPRLWVGMPVQMSFIQGGNSQHRTGTVSAVRFLPGTGEAMARVALQVSTTAAPAGAGAGKPLRAPSAGRALRVPGAGETPLSGPAGTPPGSHSTTPTRPSVADRQPPPHLPVLMMQAPPAPPGAPAFLAPGQPGPHPYALGAGYPPAPPHQGAPSPHGPPPPLMAPAPPAIEPPAPAIEPRPAFGAWVQPAARAGGELPRWATFTLLAMGALLGMAVAWFLII